MIGCIFISLLNPYIFPCIFICFDFATFSLCSSYQNDTSLFLFAFGYWVISFLSQCIWPHHQDLPILCFLICHLIVLSPYVCFSCHDFEIFHDAFSFFYHDHHPNSLIVYDACFFPCDALYLPPKILVAIIFITFPHIYLSVSYTMMNLNIYLFIDTILSCWYLVIQ